METPSQTYRLLLLSPEPFASLPPLFRVLPPLVEHASSSWQVSEPQLPQGLLDHFRIEGRTIRHREQQSKLVSGNEDDRSGHTKKSSRMSALSLIRTIIL